MKKVIVPIALIGLVLCQAAHAKIMCLTTRLDLERREDIIGRTYYHASYYAWKTVGLKKIYEADLQRIDDSRNNQTIFQGKDQFGGPFILRISRTPTADVDWLFRSTLTGKFITDDPVVIGDNGGSPLFEYENTKVLCTEPESQD